MERAKPTLRVVPSGEEPCVTDSVTACSCWLCGGGAESGEMQWSFMAGEATEVWALVHTRCPLERRMLDGRWYLA
jgi:hypothetical protein